MQLKQGIERKLLCWFLILSLVPLFIIGLIGVRQMRKSLWEDTQGEIARDITEREIGLQNLALSYRQRLDIFSSNKLVQDSLIKFNRLQPLDRSKFQIEDGRILSTEAEAFLDLAGFISVRILGKDGKPLFENRNQSLAEVFSEENTERAQSHLGLKFVRGQDGQTYVAISGPVFQNAGQHNEPIGTITLLATTNELKDVLSASVWQVFLFNQKSQLVVQIPSGAKREQIPETIIERGVRGETGIEQLEEEVIVYRHIDAIGGTLVTTIDRAEIYAPVSQLTDAFAFGGLITVILVVFLSSFASRKIVGPIKVLLDGVKKVASGNLDFRVQLTSGDEIALLAERFNEMVDEIKRNSEVVISSKEAYRAIFETGDDVRLFVGNDWNISRVNQNALIKVFGYHPDEILGKPFDFLFTQEGSLGSGQSQNHFELELRRKEGDLFTSEIHWTDVVSAKGEISGSLITIRDISEIKESKIALEKSFKDLRDFKYALDQAAIVAITDPDGTILYVNEKFCEISKYSIEELRGKENQIVSDETHSREFLMEMWRTLAKGGVWKGQSKNKAKDGSIYWVDTTIVPFLTGEGKPYQYLSIQTDITDRKEIEEEIRRLAHYDELTGLPNRTLFNDRLDQTIKQRSWKKLPFAVMFLDLDRFKIINDSLGHSAGDQLLRDVSDRLIACLRSEDTVARMGGDEFTVLLPVIGKAEDVFIVAKKMVTALKEPFMIAKQELVVTGSIGISLYPDNGEDAETLMKNADAAMYRAKKNGRGKFTFYSPGIQTKGNADLEMESDLSHALEREELLLHYQPLIDMKSGKVVGMEALIRWKRGGNGMVSPAAFIPLAEECGLILPIGDWVLRTAMAQLKVWRDTGFRGLVISVNVAPPQFQEPDFVARLGQMMAVAGIGSNELKLELTESLLMKNQDEVVARLKEIKTRGVQLAIDDFGTGYSSLNYLKRFPVDTLKIDRSFVQNLPEDQDDAAIAEMIITLAYHLGLNVVAEGIETEDQLVFLKGLGCDVGQGYLFSRPIPAEAFTDFLAEAFNTSNTFSLPT